jgi:hypothetical protein
MQTSLDTEGARGAAELEGIDEEKAARLRETFTV